MATGASDRRTPEGAPSSPDGLIDRYRLEFRDPTTEQRFRDEFRRRSARFGRLAITAGVPGYLLMLAILDDADSRAVGLLMLGVLGVWVAVAWSPFAERHYEAITLCATTALAVLSMILFHRLPAATGVVIALAFVTLNFMWIFLFLRPRFPWAVGIGVGYLAIVVVSGASIWADYAPDGAPEGMVDLLGGTAGGAMLLLLYAGFLLVLAASVAYRLERAERIDFVRREELAAAHERSEHLLGNILPVEVAERLKQGESPIADEYAEVTIVFADIVGFTTMAADMAPAEVLRLLNEVFTRFDELADRHGLEKIKTIGDAYMAVAGAPTPRPDHACSAADMALAMVETIGQINDERGQALTARVGLASGPAIAGVIGTSKFSYDLWGDAVNTASRMESHGVPGSVHVAASTRTRLDDHYLFESRGTHDIKGKGPMETWLLVGYAS
jgi:class 3 adenylate cyclase